MSLPGLTRRRLQRDDPPALVQLKVALWNIGHLLQHAPLETLDFVKIIGALEEAWATRDRVMK